MGEEAKLLAKKRGIRKFLIFKYSNWEEAKLLKKRNKKILIFKYSNWEEEASGEKRGIRKFLIFKYSNWEAKL
jgi:hypothetical protein